jgi:DNA polymerase-1
MTNLIFDIEANGLDPDKVWCIVAKEVDKDRTYTFGPDCIDKGIALLNQADTLIGHNILGYDLPVLKKLYNFNFKGKIIDTLTLSRLFNPVRPTRFL